jgi:hypothetical protein
MQFKTRYFRNLGIGFIIGLIPDILISLIAAWYFKTGPGFAILIFFSLQALYLAVWAIRLILIWAMFFLSERKNMKNHVYYFLHKNNYPQPNEYEDSAISYLKSVIDNIQLDEKVRLSAAFELGTFQGFESSANYSLRYRTEMAFEDAIEEYKRYFIMMKPYEEPDTIE